MTRGPKPDLNGDLAVLGPEILLQMLAQARVDGVLALTGPGRDCWIALRSGRIAAVGWGKGGDERVGKSGARGSRRSREAVAGSGAASRARSEGMDARAARVPSEAERRMRGAERPPRSLPPALGGGSSADHDETIRAQVREVLSAALGWRQGGFSFQRGVQRGGDEVGFEVEELLLDCMTRLDRARVGRDGAEGV